jgi:fluoride exporter
MTRALSRGLPGRAMDWRGIALVAIGGALGCVTRFGVSSLLATKGFPWATLAVNLAGSLAIGYLLLDHGMDHAPRLLLVVGFLGGFTTLSAYSAETVELWRGSHVGLAVANLVANGVGGPLAALVGWKLAA